jgi:ribonuclease BN (tRNA processing enzyme)
VQITVLGKSPSWQDVDGACSGYLIQQDGYALVLDCGNGVFAKLRRFHDDYSDIDAVLISHLHADHFLDLIPYSYALIHGPRHRQEQPRPAVYVPDGGRDFLRRVVGNWGDPELIETAFELREYTAVEPLSLGPLQARLSEVPHYTRTFAVDLESAHGHFTFGADCGPNDALVELADNSDLLLIEATLPQADQGGQRGHMTAREAGEHGRRASVRRLVITHISDEIDADRALADAQAGYGGPVELAREGAVYTIDPGNLRGDA